MEKIESSLTFFVLKTLERIRASVNSDQHAYTRGRFAETVFRALVENAEKTLVYKKYLMATFIDVKGAFNNVLIGSSYYER